MEVIEKLEINDIHIGICWAPEEDYLYDTRLMHNKSNINGMAPLRDGFISLTGWITDYGAMRKYWFLNGFRTSAQEVFDSLTNSEKNEAIWELNEWK